MSKWITVVTIAGQHLQVRWKREKRVFHLFVRERERFLWSLVEIYLLLNIVIYCWSILSQKKGEVTFREKFCICKLSFIFSVKSDIKWPFSRWPGHLINTWHNVISWPRKTLGQWNRVSGLSGKWTGKAQNHATEANRFNSPSTSLFIYFLRTLEVGLLKHKKSLLTNSIIPRKNVILQWHLS